MECVLICVNLCFFIFKRRSSSKISEEAKAHKITKKMLYPGT